MRRSRNVGKADVCRIVLVDEFQRLNNSTWLREQFFFFFYFAGMLGVVAQQVHRQQIGERFRIQPSARIAVHHFANQRACNTGDHWIALPFHRLQAYLGRIEIENFLGDFFQVFRLERHNGERKPSVPLPAHRGIAGMDRNQAGFEILIGDVATALADDMTVGQADENQVFGEPARKAVGAGLEFAAFDVQILPP